MGEGGPGQGLNKVLPPSTRGNIGRGTRRQREREGGTHGGGKARASPAKVPRNMALWGRRTPLRARGIFLGAPFRGGTEN